MSKACPTRKLQCAWQKRPTIILPPPFNAIQKRQGMNVSPHLQGSLNNLLDIRINYASLGNVDPAFDLSEQLRVPLDHWVVGSIPTRCKFNNNNNLDPKHLCLSVIYSASFSRTTRIRPGMILMMPLIIENCFHPSRDRGRSDRELTPLRKEP